MGPEADYNSPLQNWTLILGRPAALLSKIKTWTHTVPTEEYNWATIRPASHQTGSSRMVNANCLNCQECQCTSVFRGMQETDIVTLSNWIQSGKWKMQRLSEIPNYIFNIRCQNQLLTSQNSKGHREKTAPSSHHGLFQFIQVQFGLNHAPGGFQLAVGVIITTVY